MYPVMVGGEPSTRRLCVVVEVVEAVVVVGGVPFNMSNQSEARGSGGGGSGLERSTASGSGCRQGLAARSFLSLALTSTVLSHDSIQDLTIIAAS